MTWLVMPLSHAKLCNQPDPNRWGSEMSRLALIRSHVETRVPGALRTYQRPVTPMLRTGLSSLDQCGIPVGAMTQICAPPQVSSGSTSLLVSIVARLTGDGHFCALVDASDSFDPEGAERAGVFLDRLLWVRCSRERTARKKVRLKPLEQAFKAADILVQNGGFSLIVLDLSEINDKDLRKVPLTTWFRFARVVEKTEMTLIVLAPYSAAQSCAVLTLDARMVTASWSNRSGDSHTVLLSSTDHQLEVARDRARKEPQSVKPAFISTPKWA
jgi:recombination protein RecA